MNCERARQVEMDDDLKPALLGELLRHQQECADCRRLADEQARLGQLLEDWKLAPGFGHGFDARLERRLQELRQQAAGGAGWRPALWQPALHWLRPLGAPLAGAAVALALLLTTGTLFRGTPAAPATAQVQADPLMRDLQVLDRDGDLLANFDFLNAQAGANAPMTNAAAPHSN